MPKILKSVLIIFVILAILYVILFRVFDIKSAILKFSYPKKYAEYVNKYARIYEVDPLLIFSMIKIESNFNKEATSKSNAKGLMQLMESTANEIYPKVLESSNYINAANKETNSIKNENNEEQIDLYDPELNIQLGTYYFSILLGQYNNIGIALAAYNAGMGRVNEWISSKAIKNDGSDLENIPYQETNMYVRKVLNYYEIYKELYKT